MADNIAIDNSGVAGFKGRTRSGSEARDFQYPNNPAMLIGWDKDNDGSYPPHDPDDTSVLFGGQPLCATHALEFDLNAPVSYLEIASLPEPAAQLVIQATDTKRVGHLDQGLAPGRQDTGETFQGLLHVGL